MLLSPRHFKKLVNIERFTFFFDAIIKISQINDSIKVMKMVINNNVNSVLMQMQSIESMAKSTPVEVATASKQTDGTSFSDMMLKAIDTVNMNQQTAAEMSQRFEMGDKSIDLAQVMVNSQKAKISFQALNEVRNKLLTAYQDVMNMPV